MLTGAETVAPSAVAVGVTLVDATCTAPIVPVAVLSASADPSYASPSTAVAPSTARNLPFTVASLSNAFVVSFSNR